MNEQENVMNTSTDKAYTATILSDPSELGKTEENKKIITRTAIVFLIAGILYQGAQLLVAYLFGKFAPEIPQKYGSTFTMLAVLATDLLIMLPAFYFPCRNIPIMKGKPSKMSAGMFLSAICIMYAFGLLGSIIGSRISFFLTDNNTNLLTEGIGGGSTLLRFLVVGIVAPVCEELVFRKILIDRLSRYGNAFAVLTSGLMFGLFHANLQQFFYAMMLGVIFGIIYVNTRDIKYSIILHAIFNSYTSIVVLWAMEGYGTDLLKTQIYNFSIIIEILLGVIGAVLYIYFKSKKKIRIVENAVEPGEVSYMFGNIGLWIFYIVMIALTAFITIRMSIAA
ncbi:MAG: CPBP family intramembrane metalloprotease [Lachnospiraceae bacterium]|nr:CPBP family intramembrane metalloprotease [Lachnospiraceae bacterium]